MNLLDEGGKGSSSFSVWFTGKFTMKVELPPSAPGGDSILVMLNHLRANGRPIPIPSYSSLGVETLERLEDALQVPFVKANPIVTDAHLRLALLAMGPG